MAFNFAELAGFSGLTTGAGYEFQSQLVTGLDVYRIDFTSVPVPEPSGAALLGTGLLALGWLARRKRSTTNA